MIAIAMLLHAGWLHAALLFPPPVPGFRIEQIVDAKGEAQASGYVVYFTRPAAERFAFLLNEFVDEDELAKAMEQDIKQAKNKMFFWFAKRNFKQFKKDLLEKLGEDGAKVTIMGNRPLDMIDPDRTDEKKAKAREREKIIQAALPGKLKALHAMINTVPGAWKVEPLGPALHPPRPDVKPDSKP